MKILPWIFAAGILVAGFLLIQRTEPEPNSPRLIATELEAELLKLPRSGNAEISYEYRITEPTDEPLTSASTDGTTTDRQDRGSYSGLPVQDLVRMIEEDGDALPIIEAHIDRAKEGEADSQFLLGELFSLCFGKGRILRGRTAAEVLARIPAPTQEVITEFSRIEVRCRSLWESGLDLEIEWPRLKQQSRLGGFPLAVFDFATKKYQFDGDVVTLVERMQQVIASGDLYTLQLLGLQTPPEVLPTEDGLALALLACELSADCADWDRRSTQMCEQGLDCVLSETLGDRIQRLLGQAQYDSARERLAVLRQQYRNGGFQAIRLNWRL